MNIMLQTHSLNATMVRATLPIFVILGLSACSQHERQSYAECVAEAKKLRDDAINSAMAAAGISHYRREGALEKWMKSPENEKIRMKLMDEVSSLENRYAMAVRDCKQDQK
jgi:hypothetical protein